MNTCIKRLCVAVAIGISLAPLAYADSYSPRIGQRHPDITLPRIGGGEAVSLSQYRGKKVLLIHFASW